MPGIISKIKALFVPTNSVNPIYDPTPLATTLTVPGIHAVINTARSGDLGPLFTVYRDMVASSLHIQSEFSKRKLAVLGDEFSVQAFDPEERNDVQAEYAIDAELRAVRGWDASMIHLLDSTLWPVAVVEKVFSPAKRTGMQYSIKELRPVPHELIDFRSGALQIYDVDEAGRRLNTSNPLDPDRYIVHRGHMLSLADNHGGPMRSVLFWFLFSALGRDWWVRFLDRLGAPIIIGKYPAGDDESRRIIQRAISQVTRTFGVAVTNQTQLDLIQAAATSGENYEKFVTFCNREISKLIIGHTLSSEAQATGLNSGNSKTADDVRRDYRRMDAQRLANTLREQLIAQLMEINGLRGTAPTLGWIEDTSEDAVRFAGILEKLKNSGLELDDDAIPIASRKTGLKLRRAAEVGAHAPFIV